MAKRLLLHIGANKTGTSSIQRMLAENRAALAAADWDYPDFHLLHMAHHPLAYSISGNAARGLTGDWRGALAALLAEPGRRLVFSSELFFRTVSPAATAEVFPPGQTRIVLYLREHLGYMTSWYAQAVQERNLTASFADYVRLFPQPFSGYLAAWEDVYGRDNVIVRPFERAALTGQDSRLDFLQFLDGVNPGSIRMPDAESNLSMSGNLLFFKKILNNYMTYEEATTPPITDEFGAFAAVRESFSGRFFVPAGEVAMVRHLFREDRAALAQRGLVFGEMPEQIEGLRCPDFQTLQAEIKLIKDIATATQKEFLKFAERWQDWHSL